MITQKTCERIWHCYREIETGKKLLAELAELKEKESYREHAQHLKDAFGHPQPFQLGVPSGSDSRRMFDLAPELADSVIRAHIAKKEAELLTMQECARVELLAND